MIEHHELYFIQRTALRASGGGASLYTVTLDARGSRAYLAFATHGLALAYIDAAHIEGVTPVSATAPGLRASGDFDGALLLLLAGDAQVAQFATARQRFAHAGYLYHCRFDSDAPRWHALDAPAPAARPPASAVRWGLLPERPPGEAHSMQRLLLHFFVDFNPLYFISAFCVLYGVFLVARNIEGLGLHTLEAQQLILFGVIQAYEIAVIAACAVLARRIRATRPAVLLGLLECVLLFDCTFRVESAAVTEAFGHFLMVLWLILTAAKLWALAWALRLPLSRWQLGALLAVAAGMAGCIAWFSAPGTDKALALQGAAWFGALVLALLETRRPLLLSALAHTPEQEEIAARCLRTGYRVLIGAYFYHLLAFVASSADKAVTAAAVPALAGTLFLFFALTRAAQLQSWLWGVATMAIACFVPAALPWAALLAGGLWVYRVCRGGHSNLAIGAALAFYLTGLIAGWNTGQELLWHLPGIFDWQNVFLAVGLLFIAVRLRNPLAWGVLTLVMGYCSYTHAAWQRLVPDSELGRGVLFLAAGFSALLAGVTLNWLARPRAQVRVTAPTSST
ncbi:MAG TPA: hypothetical protein VGN52_16660 [Burkholderiales bacterium]